MTNSPESPYAPAVGGFPRFLRIMRKILLWFAIAVMGLYILLLLVSAAFIGVLFTLAAGWLTYPLRVWPQSSVNWDGVITAVVLAVVAVVAVHLVMKRVRQRTFPDGDSAIPPSATADATAPADTSDKSTSPDPVWRLSAAVALVAMVAMGFAFSLFTIGLFQHGKGLMKQERWFETRSDQRFRDSKQVNNLRQLALSVRLDWQGRGGGSSGVFPTREHLNALRSGDDMGPIFSTVSWKAGSTPDLWIPIEGIPVEGAWDLPLIVSPFDDNDRILVATADAKATVMTIDEWLDALEQWRPRFAELGIPWPAAFEVLGR